MRALQRAEAVRRCLASLLTIVAISIPALAGAQGVCKVPTVWDCFDAAYDQDPDAWSKFCGRSSTSADQYRECMSHQFDSPEEKTNWCRYRYL